MAAYRELLGIARRTLGYLHGVLAAVEEGEVPALWVWRANALQYGELLGRVVDQTERTVLRGEKVPAQDKVASLFEPHTDIIVKGGRHRFSTGTRATSARARARCGGRAGQSGRQQPVSRHDRASRRVYGTVPKQVACDAGYASKRNPHGPIGRGSEAR